MGAMWCLLLAGCGGGGGGGPGVETPVPGVPANGPHTVSGTSFPDVLICADLDGDGQCGPTEQAAASTVSSATGAYTLTWTGPASAPRLAMLTVSGPDLPAASSTSPLACLDANGNGACDPTEAAVFSHQAGLYQITAPAAQGPADIVFPLSPAFAPAEAPRLVQGSRHLTVYWAAIAGALDYEVYYQQAGSSLIALSRAAIAPGAGRVHTIANLNPARRYRVWVKGRTAGGNRLLSAAQAGLPVSTPSPTPQENAAFVPAVIDLPVLDISTTAGMPVVSREDYLTGTFSLYADGAARAASTALNTGAIDIRGRGNSTWVNFDKKPYRLRLGTSAALLGMPANRHWVLLANHGDKSLLRNEIAFEVSRRLGMPYTTRSRFVEVFLNGNYLGNYELAEHLRTGSNRVDIASLGPGDEAEPDISGGYLLELDWPGPDTSFTTSRCGLPLRVDAPDSLTVTQTGWIIGHMNGIESVLAGPDFADPAAGYAAWLDVDSFVNWYVLNELLMNRDAFRGSTFFTKDRNARLAIGPIWDHDLSMGNNRLMFATNPGNPEAFSRLGETCWYSRLLEDPAFIRKVRARWQAIRAAQLDSLPDFVDAQAAALAQSQANNFARWTILDKGDWPGVVVPGSHAGEVEYLRWWLQRRIAWLDAQWGP